ncbi:MAG: ExbD/TolR family protein [Candidatus Zixiibacteriota bacterium]
MQHQRNARLYARLDTKGVIGVGGESIRGRRGSIQWGDALLAKLAIEVVRRSEMSSNLFVQAEGDKRDTSTELGGLVRSRGDRFIAYGRVMTVMGAMNRAGFNRVALITLAPDAPDAARRKR